MDGPSVDADESSPRYAQPQEGNSERRRLKELIRRVRQGDAQAASALVREYEREIRTEVRIRLRDHRLRTLLETADVCQSVLASFFVRVALGQFELESPKDLVKLLARMARNKIVDQVRRQTAVRRDGRRTQPLDPDLTPHAVCDPQPLPADQVALEELIGEFRVRLSPQERAIADLRAAGCTWAEVSERLSETPDLLRKRLQKGVARVAAELGLSEVLY